MALPIPVAYWPFNEATGTTIADASGNSHTATLVNGTWDTSALKKFGAAALKGPASGRAASFTDINLGTVNSGAFWLNGWDGSTSTIIIGGTAGPAPYIGFLLSGNIYYSTGSGNFVSVAQGTLTGSHHIVITRNGTTVKFYKDGAQLGATQTLGSNNVLTLNTLGGLSDGQYPLIGTIDDVRLYNVELTAAQVAELYALIPVVDIPESVITFLSKPRG